MSKNTLLTITYETMKATKVISNIERIQGRRDNVPFLSFFVIISNLEIAMIHFLYTTYVTLHSLYIYCPHMSNTLKTPLEIVYS